MNILITGATGLIGKQLGLRLSSMGHNIYVISRDRKKALLNLPFQCHVIESDLNSSSIDKKHLEHIDGVFNLAGENIGSHRWTDSQKKKLITSRIQLTENLIQSLPDDLKFYAGASAIGIYSNSLNNEYTEKSEIKWDSKSFLQKLSIDWEATHQKARSQRSVLFRTGLVLDLMDGALPKMLFPFQAGLGGILGSGQQWMSWIHIEDLISAMIFSFENEALSGPVNLTAPHPVTNELFSKALASELKNNLGPKVPALALKLALGEMSELVLSSQKVSSEKLISQGFQFKFNSLSEALSNILENHKDYASVFYAEQFLPFPKEKVFSFFSEAENLEKITPEILNFKVLKKSSEKIQKGTLIDYKLKIHNIPTSWRTLIEDWIPEEKFIDTQINGPYKLWHHTHEFKAVPGGTLMTDRVIYKLPLNVLGFLAASLLVRKDINKIFSFRRNNVLKYF